MYKTIGLSIGITIVIVLGINFLLRADGRMIFLKTPHGNFVQTPQIVTEDGIRSIMWILPEKCTHTSYEVQEVGYTPDSGMLWGGVDASCKQTEKGYECTSKTHPEMGGVDKQWMIQATAYECDGGDHYVSEVVTTR